MKDEGRGLMRRDVVRDGVRGAVAVVLAAAVLTGCGEEKKPGASAAPSSPAKPSPTSGSGAAAAKAGGAVGSAGSACALPATFDLAAKWKPKPVAAEAADSPLAGLAKQGPFTLACEIDAKPAGHIGFLRAWTITTTSGTPRAALESFVGADKNARKPAYQEIKGGSLPATEVAYETYSKVMDASKQEHALAVVTPKGTLVLHLGGLDTQEHQEMLPAYELAKSSLKATR
ncbi:lipoprotein [Streptomyces sp. ASQP_92]|uniref:lipoprotein n=1 Tax=Streptomyces sp. ASQP_92 TaxID=2979116 RepID=UPI0021C16F85|nr:lipoprotein [Streptomyces sp. ASQP_92]MCT9091949.1 lipoprotein [Streptomyces sp. ASQP_92]